MSVRSFRICALFVCASAFAISAAPFSAAKPQHHGRTCFGHKPTIVIKSHGDRGTHDIEGTGGDDVILAGPDSLDFVDAKKGDDLICTGGISADRGDGLGSALERINGGPGRDKIRAGSGDTEIAGGPGRDLMIGGPDEDAFYPDGTFDTHGRVKGPPDHAKDVVKGGSDGSVLRGAGGDYLDSDALEVDLPAHLASGNGVGNDRIVGIEQVNAPRGDLIIGNQKRNALYSAARMEGRGSCDEIMSFEKSAVIYGDGGDDYLVGSEEGDQLFGGAGDDVISGNEYGEGVDVADCGPGEDTYGYIEEATNCETERPNAAQSCIG